LSIDDSEAGLAAAGWLVFPAVELGRAVVVIETASLVDKAFAKEVNTNLVQFRLFLKKMARNDGSTHF
jgi:hypothetical protein